MEEAEETLAAEDTPLLGLEIEAVEAAFAGEEAGEVEAGEGDGVGLATVDVFAEGVDVFTPGVDPPILAAARRSSRCLFISASRFWNSSIVTSLGHRWACVAEPLLGSLLLGWPSMSQNRSSEDPPRSTLATEVGNGVNKVVVSQHTVGQRISCAPAHKKYVSDTIGQSCRSNQVRCKNWTTVSSSAAQ
jgi:hypothetical protein